MANQIEDLEGVFQSAVAIVQNLPKDGPVNPSIDTKLKFYAYFKQATEGSNKTPKPSFLSGPTNCYKWGAWNKLGDMSKDDAMYSYIQELKKTMEQVLAESQGPKVLEDGEGGGDLYDERSLQ